MTLATDRARGQAIAQHADDPFIALLTIEHPSLPEPFRFARNREAVQSNGHRYRAAMFDLQMPPDGAEAPSARLVVSNVSRDIGYTLESLPADGQCTFRIDIVLASTPDTIERSWPAFTLQRAVWDAMTVQTQIGRAHHYDEPFPSKRITTERFRGISPDG